MPKKPEPVKVDRLAVRVSKAALQLNAAAEALAEASFACQEAARVLVRLATDLEEGGH